MMTNMESVACVQTISPINTVEAEVSAIAQMKARNKEGQTTTPRISSTECFMGPFLHTTQRTFTTLRSAPTSLKRKTPQKQLMKNSRREECGF